MVWRLVVSFRPAISNYHNGSYPVLETPAFSDEHFRLEAMLRMNEPEATTEIQSAADPVPSEPLHEKTGDKRIVVIERIEWAMSILLCAAVLFFIVARTINAGPLWRDECDSLNLARMPRFADLLEYLHYTAFPILFPTVVRTYTTLFGTSDIALRCFGLAVGIFFLGAAWFLSRSLHRGLPLLLPALIGLNINFVTAGLWLRGYGLGSAVIVLAFALTAKFLLQPNARSLTAVSFAYLASMQCLYFDGVLVPTMVLAASVVLLIRRDWKWMWLLLGVAALCGLTYLPYIWKIYSSTITWAVLVQIPYSWRWLLNGFLSACGGPHLIGAIAWHGIVLLCVTAGTWRLGIVWNTNRTRERDMLLFALLVIPIGILAQYGYLRLMKNIVIERYHLALISLIVAAATLIAANISWYYWLYFGRIALVIMTAATLFYAPWTKLDERKSNIDIIAQRVETDARPNDLIVVNDSQLGISFRRYYHGMNRWITVPEIDDHRIHRYDLIQKKMMEFFQLDDVEKEIAAALKSGNRVWIVGTIGKSLEHSGSALAPAPDPQFGWQLPSYMEAWSRQLGAFLRRHATHIDLVVRRGKSVSQWENCQLLACEGWRY
jgi:hypothetical protein